MNYIETIEFHLFPLDEWNIMVYNQWNYQGIMEYEWMMNGDTMACNGIKNKCCVLTQNNLVISRTCFYRNKTGDIRGIRMRYNDMIHADYTNCTWRYTGNVINNIYMKFSFLPSGK